MVTMPDYEITTTLHVHVCVCGVYTLNALCKLFTT